MTYTWNTVQDGHEICPYCQRLHAESWRSTGEQLLSSLTFGNLGVIWDLENGYSLVHETHGIPGKCQCFIDCNIEVLWEGTYVDYGLVKLEIEQLRQTTAEIAFNMQGGGGGGPGGFTGGADDFSWGTDRFQMYSKSLGGRGAFGGETGGGLGLSGVYHITQIPGLARRITTGNLMAYDILRLGRWSGAAAAVPQVIMVALVAAMVAREAKRIWEELHKAEIKAEQYRASEAERKRFAQWTGYR